MTDRADFEARLQERLVARAAVASRPFDAAKIARSVVAANDRRRLPLGVPAFGGRPVAILVMAGLLLALALAAVLVAGALRVVPSIPRSFGNGWIAVSANPTAGGGEVGDIYRLEAGGRAVRIVGSDGDGIAEACPQFSPDGRALAYGEARASDLPATQRGNWPVRDRAIVIVRLDGAGNVVASGRPVRMDVSTDAGEIVCPEWRPAARPLLVAQKSRQASAPKAVTLDGHPGQYLEWSVPSDAVVTGDANFAGCDAQGDHADFVSWFGNGLGERFQQVAGQVDRLWILDVAGQRLVVDATTAPDATSAARDELARVVESLRFDRP